MSEHDTGDDLTSVLQRLKGLSGVIAYKPNIVQATATIEHPEKIPTFELLEEMAKQGMTILTRLDRACETVESEARRTKKLNDALEERMRKVDKWEAWAK